MGFDDTAVREDVRRKCALVNDRPLDYVSLHTGAKYIEFARVEVGPRSAEEVAEEILVHLYDAAADASDRGDTFCKVRAKFWRKSAPAGSKVWVTEGAPADPPEPTGLRSVDDARLARDSEIVGALAQLRQMNERLVGAIESGQAAGWRVASEAMKAQLALQSQVNALQLELALAKQAPKDDGGAGAILRDILPQVAMQLVMSRMAAPAAPAPPPPPPSPPPTLPVSPASGEPPAEG